jgi:hypothetical protein
MCVYFISEGTVLLLDLLSSSLGISVVPSKNIMVKIESELSIRIRIVSSCLQTALTLIFLLQVTIIVLLTRSPQVQMVPHEVSVGSFSSRESIEWVRKKISLLGEEMQLAEVHMERMRHEFAWLKSHLERLERRRGSNS